MRDTAFETSDTTRMTFNTRQNNTGQNKMGQNKMGHNTASLSDPDRWFRIRGALLPVERDGRSFAQQLAERTGLALPEALRLEAEYRRFLYIAALTPSPREPAGLLRTAWEHHAGFEGYLYDFCPGILERHLPLCPPSKISGPAYAASRIDYASEFGTLPPAPFWPAPETRMAPPEPDAPQMVSQKAE